MATKLTYKEQLMHPNWQRKRLEMLNAADWACASCGSKDDTLHVHHRRYVKGRMAWEYENSELVVLCADCHETEHSHKDFLARVVMAGECEGMGPEQLGALIAGYLDGLCGLDKDLAEEAVRLDGYSYDLGMLASIAGGAEWDATAAAARLLAKRYTPPQERVIERWEGK